jgi:ribonucleoside-diphosphate reductase alpha chain
MERYVVLTPNNTLKMMEELGFRVNHILARHVNVNATLEKIKVKPKPAHIITTPEKTTSIKEKIEKCPVCGSINILYQETCVKCIDCGWSSCPIA